MARSVRVTLTCDVCGSARKVKPYRVGYTVRGAARKFDLCTTHAAPLLELRDAVDSRPDRRRRQMVVEER